MNRGLGRFLQGFSAGRLHHAYILCGPSGVGKKASAVEIASALIHFAELEGNEAAAQTYRGRAGFSEVASRVERKIHPDLLWIKPEERTLKVDDVRSLARDLAFAPLEGKRRVVVLESAERMNGAAANAILKILEEPPPYAVFLLLTTEAELLLPTLRSRSQLLRFTALSDAEVEAGIREKFSSQYSPEEIASAVERAWGSLTSAELYLQSEEARKFFEDSQSALFALWESAPQIPRETLAFVESLAGANEVRATVSVWLSLVRDLALAQASASEKKSAPSLRISSPKLRERLYRLASKAAENSQENIANRVPAFHRVLRELESNVNPKLLMVTLCGALQLYDNK